MIRGGMIGSIVGGVRWNGDWRARGRCASGSCSALLIGVVAGLGAVVFYAALEWATHLFLGGIAGLSPADAGRRRRDASVTRCRPSLAASRWSTTLGGLLGGLIVFTFAPGGGGARHRRRDRRPSTTRAGRCARASRRSSCSPRRSRSARAAAAGARGRRRRSRAGFGSLLGRLAATSTTRDRRIAVATGMGAGIGAIFRAPLGGAVLAAEILYLHDLEVEALIPSLIASIVGYTIFGAFSGWRPIFGNAGRLRLQPTRSNCSTTPLLGICLRPVGLLYARGFYGIAAPVPPPAAPATGQAGASAGSLVGLHRPGDARGAAAPATAGCRSSMSRRLLHPAALDHPRSCRSPRSSPPRSASAPAARAASSGPAW